MHHFLVFTAILESARQPARNGPEAMCANPCRVRHRMAHEPAHPAIAIREWMDVVQPVMRCRKSQNAGAHATSLLMIASLEVTHEIRNPVARWRNMLAHGNI